MARINYKKDIVALLLLISPLSLIATNNAQPPTPNSFDKAASLVHQQMKNDISSNKEKIKELQIKLEQANQKVDSLEKRINELDQEAQANQANNKENLDKTNTSILTLQDSVKDKTMLCGIIMAVIIVILTIIAFILKKKLSSLTSSLEDAQNTQKKLQEAQKSIESGTLSLEEKVTDLLDKQLSISHQPTSQDHSLALKVADEIVRIETNLYRMDPATRGYKQLTRSIQRMKDCFMTKGYEISDLLGKPYNEGMKVVANFVVDESLPEGSMVVTGIIKPQIIYNGKMIQSAQITVSQNI